MPLALDRASPTTLVITRRFAAPPQRVWDAHTRPDLLRRWIVGEGGTTMPVCENDPRVGGRIRYEWREPDGSGFTLTGAYEEVEPPRRTVHTEVMHLPDPTPEIRVETRFDPEGDGTRVTMTMSFPDAAALDAMLSSGMADGMEESYRQLDALTQAA